MLIVYQGMLHTGFDVLRQVILSEVLFSFLHRDPLVSCEFHVIVKVAQSSVSDSYFRCFLWSARHRSGSWSQALTIQCQAFRR